MTKKSPRILSDGLAQLGLSLTEGQLDSLTDYASLLEKWNRSFNLVSQADLAQLFSRHFLDSLAIQPYLAGAERILDIGTGAGFPGIPLAVACPGQQFILLDSNGKKTRFLFQVKLGLGLGNIEIENCRVEHYQSQQQIDIVTCRAFAPIPDIIELSRHLIGPQTTLLAMKGRLPEEELARLPEDFTVTGTAALKIPGEDSERHLITVKMRSEEQGN